jgi:hypothetical protein
MDGKVYTDPSGSAYCIRPVTTPEDMVHCVRVTWSHLRLVHVDIVTNFVLVPAIRNWLTIDDVVRHCVYI